jgi:hypothetical protein
LKGNNTEFVLLLRPFHTIGQFEVSERVPASIDQMLDPVSFAPHRDVDMETHICAALYGEAIIALGWEQPIVGAGKLKTSDADWFDVFEVLAQRAAIILLIPLGGGGTSMEIEWLINKQHLSKIVCMCPPSEEQDVATAWETTKTEFRERWGIQIPSYVASGAFFRFATGKADPISHYFEFFSQKEILQAFRSVTIRAAHSSGGFGVAPTLSEARIEKGKKSLSLRTRRQAQRQFEHSRRRLGGTCCGLYKAEGLGSVKAMIRSFGRDPVTALFDVRQEMKNRGHAVAVP